MSSTSPSTSPSTSTQPIDVVPQSYQDSRRDSTRDSTHSDIVHHLYFEDNDGFFPPRWLGQGPIASPRSSDSSEEVHEEENAS
ncbi:hypothetical protein N7492_002898 [Penicillium capsulatum]|uniref:Uncharacterized protein n=1 Tax=Penicillium capsulatum TaxID=69766 RepID=A0A9W9IK84_9EURO|nr:hypothetical protein N7492_002898 [Penicillium capsulatum]KAJ6122509.1 hypothetical protein N7512_004974 [Penicillium capsulatum]